MKHRTFAPALGALATVIIAAGVPSYASAADPSGIWAKDDGSAKMEVKKCGRSLCSKIVWLKDPNDSRGKPLHDALNENPSMRDRPNIGLPLFSNLVPTETNTWVGSVYNPEEGKIYTDVKVTLASRDQIVLRACKVWLLCGEKVWTRSTLPAPVEPEEIQMRAPAESVKPAEPTAPEGQKPIEVKAPATPGPTDIAPGSMPKPAAPIVEAAQEPIAEQPAPKPITTTPLTVGTPSETMPIEARVSVAPPKQPRSASPAASQHNTVGLGLVTTATSHPESLLLSGDSVSSLMVMTTPAPIATTPKPRVTEGSAKAASAADDQAVPAPKPKPKPKTQSAEATGPGAAAHRAVKPKPKPKPKAPEETLPWLHN